MRTWIQVLHMSFHCHHCMNNSLLETIFLLFACASFCHPLPIKKSGRNPSSPTEMQPLYRGRVCSLPDKACIWGHKSCEEETNAQIQYVSKSVSLSIDFQSAYSDPLETQHRVIQAGFPTLRKKLVISSSLAPTNYSVLSVQLMKSSWARRSTVYGIYSAISLFYIVYTISCKTAETCQICVLWKNLMCQHNCGFFGFNTFFFAEPHNSRRIKCRLNLM